MDCNEKCDCNMNPDQRDCACTCKYEFELKNMPCENDNKPTMEELKKQLNIRENLVIMNLIII